MTHDCFRNSKPCRNYYIVKMSMQYVLGNLQKKLQNYSQYVLLMTRPTFYSLNLEFESELLVSLSSKTLYKVSLVLLLVDKPGVVLIRRGNPRNIEYELQPRCNYSKYELRQTYIWPEIFAAKSLSLHQTLGIPWYN